MAANNTTTINGVVAGSGTLGMNGTGTLVLGATNNTVAGLSQSGGTIIFTNALSLGTNALGLGSGNLNYTGPGTVTLTNSSVNFTGGGGYIFNGNYIIATNSAVTSSSTGASVGATNGNVLIQANITGVGTTNNRLVLGGGNGTITLAGSNNINRISLSSTSLTTVVTNANALGNGTLDLGGALVNASSSTLTANQTLYLSSTALFGNTNVAGNSDFNFTGAASSGSTNTNGAITTWTANVNNGTTVTLSGNITNGVAGSTNILAITKGGVGTMILSGTNSYTGTNKVTAGVLEFQNTNALYGGNTASWVAASNVATAGTMAFGVGTFTGAFTTSNISTLLANLNTNGATTGLVSGSYFGLDASGGSFTLTNTVSNNIGINAIGSGTVILSGSNNYTGGTLVSSGLLQVGASNALGSTNGNLTVNGGALDIAGYSITNNALAGTGSNAVITNSGASATLTIGSSNGTGTYAGSIVAGAGTISLVKAGTGTETLSGSNSYTGGTTLNTGGLIASNNYALGGSSNSLTVTGGTLIVGTGINAAVGQVTFTGGIYGTGNVSTLSATNFLFNNSGQIFGNGNTALGGTGVLTKTNTGQLVLFGSNSYAGGTVLGQGTISVNNNNSLGTNTVTITGATGTQLQLGLTNSASALTISNSFVLNGGGVGVQGAIYNVNTNGTTLTNGTITINAITAAGGHFGSSGSTTLTIYDAITSSVTVNSRTGLVVYGGGGSYTNFNLVGGTARLGANNGLATNALLTNGNAGAGATFNKIV